MTKINYKIPLLFLVLSLSYVNQLPAVIDLEAQSVSVANSSVGSSTAISFTVYNAGTQALSNFFIGYKLNGNNSGLQSYPFTIQAGQTAVINTMSFIRPPGNFSLCAFVNSPVDPNHANDTVCGLFIAITDTLPIPYSENFDGIVNANWSVYTPGAPTSVWELGIPQYGATSSSYSPLYCYDVNLTTPYGASAQTYLVTPFFDLTSKPNSKLDFWMNCSSEAGWDGMYLQYSTDNANWYVLGSYGDANGTNWYNSANLLGSTINAPGWTGAFGGWQHITYKLASYNFNGPVKFRFAFESDAVIQTDGCSVDNFAIYQTPATDIEVSKIISPYNYNFSWTSLPVVIEITNNGTVAASNFQIKYQVDNSPVVTSTYTGTVNALSAVQASLPVFTSTLGYHRIKVFTTWATDSLKNNDTLVKFFHCPVEQALPVSDDLEGPNAGWYNASMPDTATRWELGQPNYGQTSTTHSGTKAWDINLNGPYTNNTVCYLYSPFWDIPQIPNITFSYWMNMCTNDVLRLEYSPDTTNWYFLNSYTYNQCTYQQFLHDLSAWGMNGKTQFRFHFSSDAGMPNGDGVSVDDINITSPPSYDFTIMKCGSPLPVHEMYGPIPVNIQIKNAGASSANTMLIKYELDGAPLSSFTYSSVLTYNDYEYLTLPPFTTTAGPHTFKIYIDWPSDINHANDTAIVNFTAVNAALQSLPYYNDFEATASGWYNANFSAPANTWQWGTPVYGQTSGAYSGSNCWDVNLTTAYANNALNYLYTPVFDFAGAITPKMKFWLNYNLSYYDGAFIQYSTNGATWSTLGMQNDPNAVNWYNGQMFYFNNGPCWLGAPINTWQYHQYNLTSLNLNGPVQFRFGLYANEYGGGAGISLDDFHIELALQNDAQVMSIIEPGAAVTSGVPLNPVVKIRNNGSLPLTQLQLSYDVNNVYTNSYTWTGNLPYDSVVAVTLPAYTPAPGNGTIKVYSTWPADLNAFNDTAVAGYASILSVNAPYVDNFDNAQFTWLPTSNGIYNNEWEYGIPNYGITNTCFTGTHCWDLNLNTAYNNLANSVLYSPFFNYAAITNSKLGIYVNYDTEYGADGMRIIYTTNGTTWNILGSINEPGSGNWYNSNLKDGKPGWSYQSQGWKHAYVSTPYLDGKNLVRFAFVFMSDFSITGIGATIDDFEISPAAGIVENAKFNAHIFPNPFNNKLNIDLPAYIQHGNIVVKDLFGKTVEVKNITSTNIEFDTTDWNAQTYFIHINSDASTNVFKVVKVK